jgi:hypothetical protein
MLPKNLTDIVRKKQELLLRQEQLLGTRLASYQNDILTSLISQLYSQMDIVGGVIQDTTNNYRVMAQINRVFAEVENTHATKIGNLVGSTTAQVERLNQTYFKLILPARQITKLEKVAELAGKKMASRLGYVENRLIRGGFLDGVLSTTDLATQANDIITKSVTGGIRMKDMVSQLTELIGGTGEHGFLERKFDRLAHDVFMQHDAAYSNNIANQFELNYFIYQGGLVDESRDFCREHNNRVYHRKDAKSWANWTPSKAVNIDSNDMKQKDPYKVPSYLDYIGYQPLIDRGGYNCRHSISWISDELAKNMMR